MARLCAVFLRDIINPYTLVLARPIECNKALTTLYCTSSSSSYSLVDDRSLKDHTTVTTTHKRSNAQLPSVSGKTNVLTFEFNDLGVNGATKMRFGQCVLLFFIGLNF